jgi:hypothetical protein
MCLFPALATQDLARSRSQQMKDAEQIRRQLLSCESEFFADEAAALGR